MSAPRFVRPALRATLLAGTAAPPVDHPARRQGRPTKDSSLGARVALSVRHRSACGPLRPTPRR
eukprot:789832-Alexandrium_andersonii.AAC.1